MHLTRLLIAPLGTVLLAAAGLAPSAGASATGAPPPQGTARPRTCRAGRDPHHGGSPAGRHPHPDHPWRGRSRCPLGRRGEHPRRVEQPGPRRAAARRPGRGQRPGPRDQAHRGGLPGAGRAGRPARRRRRPRRGARLAGAADADVRHAGRGQRRDRPARGRRVRRTCLVCRVGRHVDGQGSVDGQRRDGRPAAVPGLDRRQLRPDPGEAGDDVLAGGLREGLGRGQRRVLRVRPEGRRGGGSGRCGGLRRPTRVGAGRGRDRSWCSTRGPATPRWSARPGAPRRRSRAAAARCSTASTGCLA